MSFGRARLGHSSAEGGTASDPWDVSVDVSICFAALLSGAATIVGTRGVNVDRVESAWVANNVFSMPVNTPMRFVQSRAVVHAGNLGSNFTKLAPQRSNTVPELLITYPELYEEFDDALCLGL